ncbi:hypothetical protein SAMN04488123_103293 [Natribacillus halophilus]|uniref:Uncharacterized protein n=1 Tax=Natribacillus halophilus TaxID=549003 RepID=A0A1G8LWK7_9BACI|nr:hypothetical protein SAMN04488123_103293 [Natribacillus halophilus]
MIVRKGCFPFLLLCLGLLLLIYIIRYFTVAQLIYSAFIGLFLLFFIVSVFIVISLIIAHIKEIKARNTGKSVNLLLIGIWLLIKVVSVWLAIFMFYNPPAF